MGTITKEYNKQPIQTPRADINATMDKHTELAKTADLINDAAKFINSENFDIKASVTEVKNNPAILLTFNDGSTGVFMDSPNSLGAINEPNQGSLGNTNGDGTSIGNIADINMIMLLIFIKISQSQSEMGLKLSVSDAQLSAFAVTMALAITKVMLDKIQENFNKIETVNNEEKQSGILGAQAKIIEGGMGFLGAAASGLNKGINGSMLDSGKFEAFNSSKLALFGHGVGTLGKVGDGSSNIFSTNEHNKSSEDRNDADTQMKTAETDKQKVDALVRAITDNISQAASKAQEVISYAYQLLDKSYQSFMVKK